MGKRIKRNPQKEQSWFLQTQIFLRHVKSMYANEAQMRAQNDTLSGVGRFLNALFRSPSQTQLVQDANQHDRRGSHFYCAISENYMRPRSSIELRDSKQLVEGKTHTKQSVKPKRENSNEKAPSSKREPSKNGTTTVKRHKL